MGLPYQIHNIARYENRVIEICNNVYTDLFSDLSVKRIHTVYVYHVLVAYHLTGVQMGTFIGKNDEVYFVFQESTALVTENVCSKN